MANLTKVRDAKLKGLPYDGSQLPKGQASFLLLLKLYTKMANLTKVRDAKLKGLLNDGSQLPKGVLMMRKLMTVMLAFVILASIAIATPMEANAAAAWLNKDKLEKGIVTVTYAVKANVKTKLMIAKGTEKYTYSLTANKKEESFPLQMGNGEYTISLLENTSGTKYKVVGKETVKLNLKDQSVVYLNAVQNVAWNDKNAAIIKAEELTKDLKTDAEKVKAIYNYVTSNIAYDNELAQKITTEYIPDIDATFKNKKDICYGYATLFGAMLRSVDIPTKLVMGETTYVKEYHAWNEVYLDGKWVVIDTTVDASYKKAKKSIAMTKDAAKYTAAKTY